MACLRAGEDDRSADSLEGGFDIERILADEHAGKRSDQRNVPRGSVGALALAHDPAIRINTNVNLVAVDAHLGCADVGDFQFGSVVWGGNLFHGCR